MPNDLSANSPGPNKAVKFALITFVAASVAAAAYKIAAVPDIPAAAPAGAVAAGTQPAPPQKVKAAPQSPAAAKKPETKPAAEEKTTVVYYFYTNTRCSSCKAIEAYTREAVEKNFASGYKGWKIIFKGVNVEEEAGRHFVQDYWLNSKSVVVQKLSAEENPAWIKLEKVWQLLGDKSGFINYVTDETHKLLDEK